MCSVSSANEYNSENMWDLAQMSTSNRKQNYTSKQVVNKYASISGKQTKSFCTGVIQRNISSCSYFKIKFNRIICRIVLNGKIISQG